MTDNFWDARQIMSVPGPTAYKPEHERPEMGRTPFVETARMLVFDYVREHLEKTDAHVTFGPDEVYVVWFTYVLGYWKALCSTTLPDGMYYEVTYNREKNEAYLDAYKKFDNRRYVS